MKFSLSQLYGEFPIIAYFITLATVFDFATVENINYLFIGASILGLTSLIWFWSNAIPKPGNAFLFLILFYMVAVSLMNYSTIRWTSLVYSGFFVFTYVLYVPFIQKYFTRSKFRNLLKILFYMYFAGLIAGQLHIYFNVFSPISGIIGFMRGSFGTIFEKDGLRYFSLSSEPSYAAFIVIVVFYVYLKLSPRKELLRQGETLVMFVLLLYMIFMFKSAYGVLLVGLLILEFAGFSTTLVLMVIAVLGASSLVVIYDYDIRAVNRVINIAQKLDLTNLHSLFAIDFTAYYRVAPVLHFVEIMDWADLQFLLGHGAGASRYYVVPEIYGGYIGGEFLGGFLPSFLYDYGVIGGSLVLFFVFRRTSSLISFPAVALALMLLNANFNTQLFWFLILCFHMLKFYLKNMDAHPVLVPVLNGKQEK